MDSSIKAVQDLLDETARECLRYVATHELSASQYQRLSKFIFGCMNQKHELPSRIERRGSGELTKVLQFIAAAAEVLLEIDEEASGK
jgi:hypothetical protein